jgi:acyl-coenzyme A thioesterase PaaI-like protein
MDPNALEAAGWSASQPDAFSGVIGSLWSRGSGAELTLGFVAEARHSNGHLGTLHGGVMMTFADIALGCAVVAALGAPTCATAQLQLHFVAAARTGDFITCRPEIIRRTSQLIFVRGLISVGDKIVASTDGIWKVLERR